MAAKRRTTKKTKRAKATLAQRRKNMARWKFEKSTRGANFLGDGIDFTKCRQAGPKRIMCVVPPGKIRYFNLAGARPRKRK